MLFSISIVEILYSASPRFGIDGVVIQAESPAWGSPLELWNDTALFIHSEGQKKPVVLLIEDNTADALLVEEALREYRIDCHLAVLNDGEKAIGFLQAIDANPHSALPDLVLLDLNLPKRSGHEILSRIRESARCPTVPVVVVSSSQAESDLIRAKQLGITAYFHKPASFDEFMRLGALVKDLL